jgi:uncharacterized protein
MAQGPSYVIADATVLIFMHRLRLMGVLRRLYGTIIVPDAVSEEVARGKPRPDLSSLPWVQIRSVPFRAAEVTGPGIGAGESAVLSLALTLPRPRVLVLVDDLRGRNLAALLGFDHSGVVGILLGAKRAGLIRRLRPYLDRLVAAGFWVAPAILQKVLRQAGE